MFYDNNPQPTLRFGDIVGGFLLSRCHDYAPSFSEKPDTYHIEVARLKLAAVLTPCCTIAHHSGNMLVLSPLQRINPVYYFMNSYLREDLTRINRVMTIQEAIGPEKWKKMSDEEKTKHLATSPDKKYIGVNEFVYEEHDLLPEYEIKYNKQTANTNYYMIDFREICRVQKPSDVEPSAIKRLQLSVQTRAELRDKLAHYFGRKPDEDAV